MLIFIENKVLSENSIAKNLSFEIKESNEEMRMR